MMEFNLNNFYLFDWLINFLMIMILTLPCKMLKFHPFMFSVILVFYVILICVKMNYLTMNFWYSYILFMIMIGGVMILFMYFTSISNNEMLFLNFKYIIFYIFKLSLIFMFYLIIFIFFFKNYLFILNYEINSLLFLFVKENIFIMKNLYMNFSWVLNIYMFINLMLVMVCSVLICMICGIPMRKMSY